PKMPIVFALGLQAVVYYAFAVAGNTWWLLVYAVCRGFGYGFNIPAAGVYLGSMFGRKNYGKIWGTATLVSYFLAIPGPVAFGFVRDLTGNFYLPFTVAALSYVIAALLYFSITTPKGQLEPGRNSNRVAQ